MRSVELLQPPLPLPKGVELVIDYFPVLPLGVGNVELHPWHLRLQLGFGEQRLERDVVEVYGLRERVVLYNKSKRQFFRQAGNRHGNVLHSHADVRVPFPQFPELGGFRVSSSKEATKIKIHLRFPCFVILASVQI